MVLRCDIVEELSVAAVLHDEEQPLWRFDNLIKLNYGWVSNYFEDVNFSGNSFDIVDVFDFPLAQDLDGNFLPSKDMEALLHFTERALSQRLLYLIIANHLYIWVRLDILTEWHFPDCILMAFFKCCSFHVLRPFMTRIPAFQDISVLVYDLAIHVSCFLFSVVFKFGAQKTVLSEKEEILIGGVFFLGQVQNFILKRTLHDLLVTSMSARLIHLLPLKLSTRCRLHLLRAWHKCTKDVLVVYIPSQRVVVH